MIRIILEIKELPEGKKEVYEIEIDADAGIPLPCIACLASQEYPRFKFTSQMLEVGKLKGDVIQDVDYLVSVSHSPNAHWEPSGDFLDEWGRGNRGTNSTPTPTPTNPETE